jgi:hypothetical protein
MSKLLTEENFKDAANLLLVETVPVTSSLIMTSANGIYG